MLLGPPISIPICWANKFWQISKDFAFGANT
jgi:hypothetical protein